MTQQEKISAVKKLGEQIGYGNMMHIASDLWREMLLEKHNLNRGYFVPAIEINGELISSKSSNNQ